MYARKRKETVLGLCPVAETAAIMLGRNVPLPAIAKRFPVNESSFPLHSTQDRLVRNFSLNRSVTPCE